MEDKPQKLTEEQRLNLERLAREQYDNSLKNVDKNKNHWRRYIKGKW